MPYETLHIWIIILRIRNTHTHICWWNINFSWRRTQTMLCPLTDRISVKINCTKCIPCSNVNGKRKKRRATFLCRWKLWHEEYWRQSNKIVHLLCSVMWVQSWDYLVQCKCQDIKAYGSTTRYDSCSRTLQIAQTHMNQPTY